MYKEKINNLKYTVLALFLIQLISCATPYAREQVEIWDVSSIKSIAIIPHSTEGTFELDVTDSGSIVEFRQLLYRYIGKEAKKIIQETGKFRFVLDNEGADAILNCDIISIDRWSDRDQNGSGYQYRVVYNISLIRTSDGIIIGDNAGMGETRIASYGTNRYIVKEFHLVPLIHINHLRQAFGLSAKKRS